MDSFTYYRLSSGCNISLFSIHWGQPLAPHSSKAHWQQHTRGPAFAINSDILHINLLNKNNGQWTYYANISSLLTTHAVYYDFYLSLTISQVSIFLIMSVVEAYFHECTYYKSRVFAALHFAPTSSNTTF